MDTNKFYGNTGLFGGALSLFNVRIITVKAGEFHKNIANRGGVLVSLNSTIIIEFDSNNAIDSGGVLYSDSSTITMEASEFDSNNASYMMEEHCFLSTVLSK